MKRFVFRTILIVSFIGLSISWIITRFTINDFDTRIVYILGFLAIFLGAVSIIGSKHFSDSTTDKIKLDLSRLESKYDERLKSIKSKLINLSKRRINE